MADQLPYYSILGPRRLAQGMLDNLPTWWDTGTESNFYKLVGGIGQLFDVLAGDDQRAQVSSGTGTATTFSDGVGLTVSGSLESGAFVGMELRDVFGDRYLITSNSQTTIRVAPPSDRQVRETGRSAPASGAYTVWQPGSLINQIKFEYFLRTAEKRDLDARGAAVGVVRPSNGMTDDVFRKLIPLLSWEPKLLAQQIDLVLEVLLGGPKSVVGWDSYEIRQNEIVIELPTSGGGNGYATYLRTDHNVLGTDNPRTSYVQGDPTKATPDAEIPGPPAAGANQTPADFLVFGPVYITAAGDVVDEDLIQRVLKQYCRAFGVRVLVDFRSN